MDERNPSSTSLENTSVGQSIDLTTTVQGSEESSSEVALGAPPGVSAGFELSEGRNVQQGSGNTMVVHNNYYPNSANSMVRGAVGVLVVVSVLVVGYLYSESTVKSRSLPSIAPWFIGRENYVNGILKKISYGEGPIVVNIVGAPGFGKSALAVAVGHELLRNGIRVLYVDLNHIDNEKLAVIAILSTVIDGAESSDPQQLYRWADRLRTRRVLILDNCDSLLDFDNQGRRNRFLNFVSKLGGYSSKLSLLTTSRYQFTILDTMIETLEIGPLSDEASQTLLQSMYSQLSRSNCTTLAKLTGRNALALKVTGALLKEGVPLSALVKELRLNPIQTLSPDDFRPEEQVRACISSSFIRLSKQLRVALATLAHVPGTFDESDAASILNVTNSTVHGSLPRQLRKRCLLEYDDRAKRYHLHSLIAAYAKDKGGTYTKPLTVERNIVRCYFRKLMDIAVGYKEAPLVALKRYDLDQQNFYHLLTMLIYPTPGIEEGGTMNSRSVSALAIMSAGLIDARVSPSRRVMWYRTAMTRSKMVLYSQGEILQEDRDSFCHLLHLFIKALARRGDMVTAKTEVKQQKRHVADCANEYRVLILMTVCLTDSATGDLTEENLECHRLMSEPLAIPSIKWMKSFFSLANYYYSEGYVPQAYNCYKSAEVEHKTNSLDSELENPVDWTKQTISMLETYSHVEKKMEFVDKWLGWLHSSYELMSDKFTVSPETAEQLYQLGIALSKVSNKDALNFLFRSEKIQTEVFREDHVLTLLTLQAIGHVYFDVRNYTLAVDYYNRSLAISRRIHDLSKTYTANLLVFLGNALDSLDREDAINYWKEALEILGELKLNVRVIRLLLRVGIWHGQRLELFTAHGYYARAYRIADSLDSKEESISAFSEARIPTSTSTELQSIDNMLTTKTLISILSIVLRPIADLTGWTDDVIKPPPVKSDAENAVDNAYSRYYSFLFGAVLYYVIVLLVFTVGVFGLLIRCTGVIFRICMHFYDSY